jgi:uncharacterized membrane protein (DUF485 family)
MTQATRPSAPVRHGLSARNTTSLGRFDEQVRNTANGAPDFVAIQRSTEFAALRRRLRRFIFTMSAVFFVWYMVYVLFAAYDHSFMDHKIFGQINLGLIFGLLQFVSTVIITLLYTRFARKQVDPSVEEIRAQAGASVE